MEDEIQEIRLRVGQMVVIIRSGKEVYLDEQGHFTTVLENAYCVREEDVNVFFRHICHDSPYAFEEEIRQGFITVPGGHRVGVCGQVVTEGRTSVQTMKHIYYLNIRVAHEVKGVADFVLPQLYDNGRIKNILMISPPGCGKTTLLRDVIRQVSDGNQYSEGMCVGLVDERSEVAGSYLGQPQNDVGRRTDVLDACPKELGMMLLVRSMSPQVIAVDEIGNQRDMDALRQAAACGSKLIATVHGEDVEDYLCKFGGGNLSQELFDCFLVLGKENGMPMIRKMLGKEDVYASILGR